MTAMLFMVVERFRDHGAKAVYDRACERGRMMPATRSCFKVRAFNASGVSAYHPTAESEWGLYHHASHMNLCGVRAAKAGWGISRWLAARRLRRRLRHPTAFRPGPPANNRLNVTRSTHRPAKR